MQAQRESSWIRWALPIVLCVFVSGSAAGHFGPIPISMKGAPVPTVPGLVDGPDPIVVDAARAIALGKALFWDTQVGSDGIACASCHFHAGADSRVKNQLAPSGVAAVDDPDFEMSPDGVALGPNYSMLRDDFPLFQTQDPLFPNQPIVYQSNDVVSSSGSFGGQFDASSPVGSGVDSCERAPDGVFHVGPAGTRRVEPRNAPSVINAIFNFRNLWDGAANNVFNGSSQWGDRDPEAGVWLTTGPASVERQRLQLVNASLASQALAPPLSGIEMSCEQRKWADIGRKLSCRRPLASQHVHWEDSVLGPLARSTPNNLQKGLATSYYELISQAFAPRYWSFEGTGEFGAPAGGGADYTQYEANFAMFFALALQLYQETLISDDSPFDKSARDELGIPIDLSESAQNGFTQFRVGHCNLCHIGPAFTSAAVVTNAAMVAENPDAFGTESAAVSTTQNVVTRFAVAGGPSLTDTGFASTGVTPADADVGLAAEDPWGNPLSFSAQYLELIAGNSAAVVDPYVDAVRPCDFDLPLALDVDFEHPVFFTRQEGVTPQSQGAEDCFMPQGAFLPEPSVAAAELASPSNHKMLGLLVGSLKIPSLRNVELTGPYMHNGSMATLEEVLQSYTRGGNLEPDAKHFGTVFPQVQLRGDARADVIEFLKSLTDERVRYERAPFDHPEIFIPHGHAGDHTSSELGHPIDAELSPDEFLHVPAVGASGRDAPLQPFESYLPPCEGGCEDRLSQSGPGAAVPLGPDAPEICTLPEPSQPWQAALAALVAMSLARRSRD